MATGYRQTALEWAQPLVMLDYISFVFTAIQWPRSTFTICSHIPACKYNKSVKALPLVQYEKNSTQA